MIDSKSGKTCYLVDPDGPVVWLGNKHLVGRKSFGKVKNGLVIWTAISGASVVTIIPMHFVHEIDYIKVLPQGSEEAVVLAAVVSNKDKKLNFVDLLTHKIEESKSCEIGKDVEITHRLISPDGKKIVVREDGPSGAPVLKVYDLVENS